ncbi:MAG: hypothetical protein ACFFCW_00375 [Candidatus Hodarchaeota archaeon]
MALTLTEKFRWTAGGRAFRVFQVTHDEATSTIAAASVDLSYVEFVMQGTPYLASDVANTSVLLQHMAVSITGNGTTIEFALPPKTGSKSNLLIIGW